MAVRKRGGVWQVHVKNAKARPGYGNIRRSVKTEEEAIALESKITATINTFGVWPQRPGDKPLPKLLSQSAPSVAPMKGTIEEACEIALATHWGHLRYGANARSMIKEYKKFFHGRNIQNLDAIVSDDIDAFKTYCLNNRNSQTTINKKLHVLAKIMGIAQRRTPPLMSRVVHISYLPVPVRNKWWLTPDAWAKLEPWLYGDGGLPDLAEYIAWELQTGLRVEETLKADRRRFVGLGTGRASIMVAGTKTQGAQTVLPLSAEAEVLALKRFDRYAVPAEGDLLFPMSYPVLLSDWSKARAFLGLGPHQGVTLKALRRTFAKRVSSKMGLHQLKDYMRHELISTTDGYLRLVGREEMEELRGKL